MWIAIAFGLFVVLVLAVTGWLLDRARQRRVARERLSAGDELDPLEPSTLPRRSRIRRYYWIAFVAAVTAGLALYFAVGVPWPYAAALATLVGLVGWQIEQTLHAMTLRRIEGQLADAIDMAVAAVKAGASLLTALDSAASNVRMPLREELHDVVARIRYGEAPDQAMLGLAERLPLETVSIFATALAVNWETGGRLAPTLANVGRTIRDRIEISRRLDAMTVQARLSVASIVVVTYFIAALMWRNDPERMAGFLGSVVGQSLVAISMALQGVGIFWIAQISRARF